MNRLDFTSNTKYFNYNKAVRFPFSRLDKLLNYFKTSNWKYSLVWSDCIKYYRNVPI